MNFVLTRYFLKRFFTFTLLSCAGFAVLVGLFDFADALRKYSALDALLSAFAHVPDQTLLLLPFSLFVATLLYFHQFNKFRELTILKSKGVSPYRLACMPVFCSVLLGLLAALITPAIMEKASYGLDRLPSTQSDFDLRLVQNIVPQDGANELLIRFPHAQLSRDCKGGAIVSNDASVFLLDETGGFISRIQSPHAILCDNQWRLSDAIVFNPSQPKTAPKEIIFSSPLNAAQISATRRSFNVTSVFALPKFIDALSETGFDVRKYRIYLQTLLALPLFCGIMCLAGCAISLALRPETHILSPTFLIEIGAGFGLFAFLHVAEQVGKIGLVSPLVAIWVPLFMILGLVAHIFLHRGTR